MIDEVTCDFFDILMLQKFDNIHYRNLNKHALEFLEKLECRIIYETNQFFFKECCYSIFASHFTEYASNFSDKERESAWRYLILEYLENAIDLSDALQLHILGTIYVSLFRKNDLKNNLETLLKNK